MGAYEYNPAIDQTPVIRLGFTFANFATGYAVPFVAEIGGCADYFWWDFGDGTTVTNQYNVSHAWTSPGTYNVRADGVLFQPGLWVVGGDPGSGGAIPGLLCGREQPQPHISIHQLDDRSPHDSAGDCRRDNAGTAGFGDEWSIIKRRE